MLSPDTFVGDHEVILCPGVPIIQDVTANAKHHDQAINHDDFTSQGIDQSPSSRTSLTIMTPTMQCINHDASEFCCAPHWVPRHPSIGPLIQVTMKLIKFSDLVAWFKCLPSSV